MRKLLPLLALGSLAITACEGDNIIGENIMFEDSLVKTICVENWDSNDDGELSYAEAAEVTNIGEKFRETEITSFKELAYFTGLTSLVHDAFSGCNKLTNIIIPKHVTKIGWYAFASCGSLESIILSDDITEIGRSAFNGCCKLKSITLPNKLETIMHGTFYNCQSLTSITIPGSVAEIDDAAFAYCTNLESAYILHGVTQICGSFAQCTNLKYVYIPNSVTTIVGGAFGGCLSLETITIPDSVTTFGDREFWDCKKLKEVFCEPTTPPTIGVDVFGWCPLYRIYVPHESVEAYKREWSAYSSSILGYDFGK